VGLQVDYGLYHGMKLTYHSQHFLGAAFAEWPTEPLAEAPMQALLAIEGTQLAVTLLGDGRPLPDVEASLLFDPDAKPLQSRTDASGVARFDVSAVPAGLVGVLAGVTDRDATGVYEGAEFKGAANYLTVTFWHDAATASATPAQTGGLPALPPLPTALASFGGAACSDWVYAYSGHVGEEHAHSRDNLSTAFLRAPLDGSGGWEALPCEQPLQGLALVAHQGRIIRVGGLSAQNAAGEDADLHSQATVACFDPATGEWSELPPLPQPLSSHNAAVAEGRLVVVGGWTLAGGSGQDGVWNEHAYVLDLRHPDEGWQTLPGVPLPRRALAAAAVGSRIYALGGMTADHEVTCRVDVLDLATGRWTSGPELPGEGMEGFGLAACNVNGRLIVGGMGGSILALNPAGAGWEAVAPLEPPRFFHQFVAVGPTSVIAVGGATADGHIDRVERIELR
jgi:hypothetical protein